MEKNKVNHREAVLEVGLGCKNVEAIVAASTPLTDDQNLLVTVYSMMFLRFFVYCVNAPNPRQDAIKILWSVLIWLDCVENISCVTKANLTDSIIMNFAVLR